MSALGLNKNARSRLKNDSESEECISSFAYALFDVLLKIRKLDSEAHIAQPVTVFEEARNEYFAVGGSSCSRQTLEVGKQISGQRFRP